VLLSIVYVAGLAPLVPPFKTYVIVYDISVHFANRVTVAPLVVVRFDTDAPLA
jgi:hypothetical protein